MFLIILPHALISTLVDIVYIVKYTKPMLHPILKLSFIDIVIDILYYSIPIWKAIGNFPFKLCLLQYTRINATYLTTPRLDLHAKNVDPTIFLLTLSQYMTPLVHSWKPLITPRHENSCFFTSPFSPLLIFDPFIIIHPVFHFLSCLNFKYHVFLFKLVFNQYAMKKTFEIETI